MHCLSINVVLACVYICRIAEVAIFNVLLLQIDLASIFVFKMFFSVKSDMDRLFFCRYRRLGLLGAHGY